MTRASVGSAGSPFRNPGQAQRGALPKVGGQTTQSDRYFNLSGLSYSTSTTLGTENTHFYRTRYGYDDRGRSNRVQAPTGTISRTVYDALSRPVSSWLGTNDTGATDSNPAGSGAPNNMVQLSASVYDGGNVGDSNLTEATAYPRDGTPNRVTNSFYDWRNRLVATKSGVQGTEGADTQRPIFYTEYDNLSQAIAQEQYDGDTVSITLGSDGVPQKPASTLRRARTETSYDEQGRAYRSQTFSVNQTDGTLSTNSLTSNTWFDHRGQAIKTSAPGGLVSKVQYDGAGRVKKTFTTDGGGDTSWADAANVTGDIVLSQVETQYDANSNVIFTIARERFHDETLTGELSDQTGTAPPYSAMNPGPKARVSYSAAYYDAINRLTASVEVGTNGGTAWTRPSPDPPARSDTVLVTSYTFHAAGWVETVTDPRALVRKNFYDNLGRTTKTVEAHDGGAITATTNKTTEYTYDGNSNLLTLKALLTGGAFQTTQRIYGVSTSVISSNDLLAEVRYPDKTTGNPSTLSSDKETYTYNALGERLTRSDRNGSVHSYSYDVLGRMTADAVTTLGGGVNGAVRRIETAYDTAGRPFRFTSYDAATGGNVANQVERVYNGLSQLITEYQAHSGVVNTGTTPKVQYAYSEMAGGANHSRMTSVTYPNGRVINYTYATGLDNTISRLSSLTDGAITLEGYSYLGLGTVVIRSHPQPGVDLTYLKQGAEGNGDAGDQYTGLDRFGRVVDQRWRKTSDGTHTDRFQYGYDRDSNRLYRENLVDATFSELYHANGASNGYDPLNQLSAFARGTLNGAKDTITTPSRSQDWSYDALGNWNSVTTDSTTQTREHDKQNQITSIAGLTTPTYDNNGNVVRP